MGRKHALIYQRTNLASVYVNNGIVIALKYFIINSINNIPYVMKLYIGMIVDALNLRTLRS